MKKIVLLLVFVLSLPVLAQDKKGCVDFKGAKHPNRAEWIAQMRAKKLVYLVDAMQLTETEKAAFSVLFNKHEEEVGECHRTMRQAKKSMSEEPTNEEYKKVVEVARVQMLRMAQLRAEYLEKLEKIMPAQKIYKLYEAEESYKRLLISDMGKCKRIDEK